MNYVRRAALAREIRITDVAAGIVVNVPLSEPALAVLCETARASSA
jgi:hypothetical protein